MRFGRKTILRLTGFIVLLVAWHFAGQIRASPAIPAPFDVFQTAYALFRDGTLWPHIAASLDIIVRGVGIAVFFGLILGLLMFRYTNFRIATLPVIESVRGIAALTLFPLLIVLLGIGPASRIFVIFWTAWPAVVLSTINSLHIDSSITDAAKICGAGEWRTIFSIRAPIGINGIITGIRIGIGGGWIGLVAAEMLGASRGLGYFLLWAAQSFRFDRVYAVIIVIAVIGGLMNYALLLAQKHISKFLGVD